MSAIARFLRQLRQLLRLRSSETELNVELEFHRQMKLEALRNSGRDTAAAELETRRAMGNVTASREAARGIWVRPWLESALQDFTYAMRGLRRQPRFALAAIATLGVAIGANTSVFTAFNGAYLQPWRVADPAGLFQLSTVRNGRERQSDFSLDEFRAASERIAPAAKLAAIACAEGFDPGCDVRLGDATLRPAFVSANAFDVLGVPMARGRGFAAEEDRHGAPEAVVVLGFELWQRTFAADPAIVGKLVRIDGIPFTVVGVAPAEFAGTSIIRTDAWFPLASLSLLRKRDAASRENHLQLAARLADPASAGRVRAGMESIIRDLRAQLPATQLREKEGLASVRMFPTRLDPNPTKRTMGFAMFGLMFVGSGLVILLACANLANLHLARAAARGREIAIRVSIGASRRRIVRQLLSEAFVLAAVASAAGLLVAWYSSSPLLAWIADAPLSGRTFPDARVFAYGAALAFGTCLVFGLAPALHATRPSVGGALKGRYGFGGREGSMRQRFLGVQVAVSVMVLCGAGFLYRGASRAGAAGFGFTMSGVNTVSVTLPATRDSAQARAFASALNGAVTTSVDAHFAAATTMLPFEHQPRTELLLLPGQDSAAARNVETLSVAPGYFDVLAIPLSAGRMLSAADAGRDAVVINEALARRLWPGEPALGRQFTLESTRQVVGIVKDADTEGVAPEEGSVRPKVYEPLERAGAALPTTFVVRDGSGALTRTVATLATTADPDARIAVAPVRSRLDLRLAESRRTAMLVAAMGVTALVLVGIGVFGVFAYVVQQRTREIGVRIALGATARDVIALVIRSSARPMVIGLGVGLLAAIGESQLLRGYLYGLSPMDPVTYLGVAGALGVAALIAVYVPSHRAARISPVVALRSDEG